MKKVLIPLFAILSTGCMWDKYSIEYARAFGIANWTKSSDKGGSAIYELGNCKVIVHVDKPRVTFQVRSPDWPGYRNFVYSKVMSIDANGLLHSEGFYSGTRSYPNKKLNERKFRFDNNPHDPFVTNCLKYALDLPEPIPSMIKWYRIEHFYNEGWKKYKA